MHLKHLTLPLVCVPPALLTPCLAGWPPPCPAGDLLPRPCFLEASVQRSARRSLSQHYLRTYARSFAAVIRGQFERKATGEASRAALRRLAACTFVQVGVTVLVGSPLLGRAGLFGCAGLHAAGAQC